MRRTSAIAAATIWVLVAAAGLRAQMANPVYPDDSPSARDTLSRVGEFVRSGNEPEAVRELQRLLEEQPHRVVQAAEDADLFVSVREMVHRTLLGTPELLARYREAEEPAARRELEAGRHGAVEESRLLTRAGLEAALRVAQEHLEAGRFEASRLTLEQLETHPDRRGRGGADAARAAAMLARYLPRPEVAELARRWAAEAGVEAPGMDPAERPAALSVRLADVGTPAPVLEAGSLPREPLWTSPVLVEEDAGADPLIERTAQGRDVGAAWMLPTVVGDTVYVNDGTWVSARDRFTLRPRWAVRPGEDGAADEPWGARGRALTSAMERQVEDTNTVSPAAAGRVLVATTGIAYNESRDGDPRTHALDADGRVLWSVDVAMLDPQLEGGSVRGPALIDPLEGETVVLSVRKSSQARRVVGVALVGLDLRTGSLRWVRPVASAGAMPLRSEVRVANAGLLHRGVVYVTDQVGVIAAVEAETGRPVWVRRRPVSTQAGPAMELGSAWQWSVPLADGETIVTLSPDRLDVLQLDARTGAITARRAAGVLGDPAYLVRAGEFIAAVGLSRIGFVPAAELASGTLRLSPAFGPPGIRGRVAVAAGRVLVPLADEIAVLDPAEPKNVAGRIELERTGNILALEDQVVIGSGGDLHSFLSWEIAQRLLQERMDQNPADPSPAVIYGELAYRSGHPELIAGAADRALAAIERNPASPVNRAERARLFESLRAMAEASQEAVAEPAHDVPALPLAVLGDVVHRLGLAAEGHDQRVTHLMALGRLHEMQGRPGLAAESYQRVLGTPELAGAVWRGPGASVRAELEAARRVRQLVVGHGPRVYAAFDAEAADRAARLGAGASADALESLAKLYPGAAIGPELWTRAAELHERAGRTHAAITALREALLVAETSYAAGREQDAGGAALGAIAGRLVRLLESQDQLFAATQLLRRMSREYPAVALTDRGAPLDAAGMGEDLVRRLSSLERFPRIGPAIRPEAQVLPGWSIMAPLGREGSARAGEHIVMLSARESRIGLWGVGGAGRATGVQTGGLEMLWSREYEGRPPVLLRLDPEAVYLFWPSVRGGSIERIDAVGGTTRWRTEPFTELFRNDPETQERINAAIVRGDHRIDTPLDGPVRLTDLLVAIDEQVVALVERSGRAAAFDPATGALLWTLTGPVTQVHDVDAGAGVVAIGGNAGPVRQRGLAEASPAVVVYDARTGEARHRMEDLSGGVRWLRLSDGPSRGLLVAGLESEATALDLESGAPAWTLTGGPAFGSMDAWVIADRLYLLDANRTIWAVPLATGRAGDAPLDTYEHLETPGAIEATGLGEHVAFSTPSGVVVFDAQGGLVGMDGLGAAGGLLPPVAAESMFVALEAAPEDENASRPVYGLHLLESPGGRLVGTHRVVLWEPPRRVAVLDGRILITAGEVTVVLSAPEVDR